MKKSKTYIQILKGNHELKRRCLPLVTILAFEGSKYTFAMTHFSINFVFSKVHFYGLNLEIYSLLLAAKSY